MPLLSFQTIKCEALADSDDDRCNQQERSRSDNKQPAGADTLEKEKQAKPAQRDDSEENRSCIDEDAPSLTGIAALVEVVQAWLLPNPDVVHAVKR